MNLYSKSLYSDHAKMLPLIPVGTIHVIHEHNLTLDILHYYVHSIHHINKTVSRARIMTNS